MTFRSTPIKPEDKIWVSFYITKAGADELMKHIPETGTYVIADRVNPEKVTDLHHWKCAGTVMAYAFHHALNKPLDAPESP